MTDLNSGAARQAQDFLATLRDDEEIAEFVKAARGHGETREFARNLFASDRDDGRIAGMVPRGGTESE